MADPQPTGSRALAGVLIVCLGINLVIAAGIAVGRPSYLFDYRLSANPDALHYVLLGRNTLLHGSFSRSAEPPYVADSLRTPVYPLFAGALDLVGRAAAIYGSQVALQVLGCVLLFHLTKAAFGAGPAIGASLLFATDPLLAISNFEPMSESLFVFLLLSSTALVLPFLLAPGERSQRGRWQLVGGSLLLSLAILTRPAGLYLPLIYACGGLLIGWRRKEFRASLSLAVVLLMVSLAPVAGWIGRNVVVCSLPRLTSVEANNMVYFFGAGAYQVRHNVSLEEAQAMIAEEYQLPPYHVAQNAHRADRPAAEIDAQLRRAMPAVLAKHPAELVLASGLAVVKASLGHNVGELAGMLGRTWVHPQTRALLRCSPAAFRRLGQNGGFLSSLFVWQLAHVALSLLAAVVGLAAALREPAMRPAAWLLLAGLAYFYLTIALFGLEAYSRCRVPALPFLYLFSGIGASRLFARQRTEDRCQGSGVRSQGTDVGGREPVTNDE